MLLKRLLEPIRILDGNNEWLSCLRPLSVNKVVVMKALIEIDTGKYHQVKECLKQLVMK